MAGYSYIFDGTLIDVTSGNFCLINSISKSDLDSFVSASSTNDFKRLILVDTSNQEIGKNAQLVLNNLNQEYIRIQSNEFKNSQIDWSTYLNNNKVSFKK